MGSEGRARVGGKGRQWGEKLGRGGPRKPARSETLTLPLLGAKAPTKPQVAPGHALSRCQPLLGRQRGQVTKAQPLSLAGVRLGSWVPRARPLSLVAVRLGSWVPTAQRTVTRPSWTRRPGSALPSDPLRPRFRKDGDEAEWGRGHRGHSLCMFTSTLPSHGSKNRSWQKILEKSSL